MQVCLAECVLTLVCVLQNVVACLHQRLDLGLIQI